MDLVVAGLVVGLEANVKRNKISEDPCVPAKEDTYTQSRKDKKMHTESNIKSQESKVGLTSQRFLLETKATMGCEVRGHPSRVLEGK